MPKTILKEVIIALLLCLAILLVLAVLLYSYIPNNKVIPELVAYTAPDDAKQALTEAGADTSQVILTYEINSSDLSTAQKTNEYNPGKVNPFSTYQKQEPAEETNTNTAGGTNNGGTNSGSTTSGNTTSGGSSNGASSEGTVNGSTSGGTGTYYTNKGTK